MQVIGAGLPRTGTLSMQAALNQLGYPCYHMQNVPREPGHLQAWDDVVTGRSPMDWRRLFERYEATVDAPGCFFYDDLIRTYPEAKVVLTVRDPERWYASLTTLMRTMDRLRPLRFVIPKLRRFLCFIDHLTAKFFEGARDRDTLIRLSKEHNAAVQQAVPAERLLVFQVKDGWGPLCAFLGCEVPDTPFPHLNEGDATLKAGFRELFLAGPLRVLVLAAGVLGLGCVAWLLFT